MENNTVKKTTFNTIFRTPFFADTKKKRTIYSSILYSVTALLFIFLILALVVTNSWTTNVNSALSDFGTNNINKLFGSQDVYIKWSNSEEITHADFWPLEYAEWNHISHLFVC